MDGPTLRRAVTSSCLPRRPEPWRACGHGAEGLQFGGGIGTGQRVHRWREPERAPDPDAPLLPDTWRRKDPATVPAVQRQFMMDDQGRFIEVQGTAEGHPFTTTELEALLGLAGSGIREIIAAQRATLAG